MCQQKYKDTIDSNRRSLKIFTILLFTFLCSRSAFIFAQQTFVFGVVPQQSATNLARSWVPLLQYLSEKSNNTLKFATAPNIPEFEKRLISGVFDFAYMNPYHYTVAHRSPGYNAFAKDSGKKIKGILVVKKDSDYDSIESLKGLTIAFPSPAAFAASVLPRANLSKLGIAFVPTYVSSHDSVYRNVAAGLLPAGGGIIRTYNAIDPLIRADLRILWTSSGYTPHAFAAHPRVNEEIVESIKQILSELNTHAKGSALLETLNFKQLQPARDSDWDDVRLLGIDLLEALIRK